MATFRKLRLVNDTATEDTSVEYRGPAPGAPPTGSIYAPQGMADREHATAYVRAVIADVRVFDPTSGEMLASTMGWELRRSFTTVEYISEIDIRVYVGLIGTSTVWIAEATLYGSVPVQMSVILSPQKGVRRPRRPKGKAVKLRRLVQVPKKLVGKDVVWAKKFRQLGAKQK